VDKSKRCNCNIQSMAKMIEHVIFKKNEGRRVLFVAANPRDERSLVIPFYGTRSGQIFSGWIHLLGLTDESVEIINASDRIAKTVSELRVSDYNLIRLKERIEESTHVIALGNYAASGIERVTSRSYLKLPHPSGLNRQLNDPLYLLAMCRKGRAFLEKPCTT